MHIIVNTTQLFALADEVLSPVSIGTVETESQDYQLVFLPGEENNLWPGE